MGRFGVGEGGTESAESRLKVTGQFVESFDEVCALFDGFLAVERSRGCSFFGWLR